MVRSFRKQVVDSRVLGRGRHQVIQDNHVSYSGIEVVIAVQVVRDVSDEFHPRNHRPTYLIVEGLPSLVLIQFLDLSQTEHIFYLTDDTKSKNLACTFSFFLPCIRKATGIIGLFSNMMLRNTRGDT